MAGQGFASPYVFPAWTTWTSWAVALGSFLAIIAVAGRGTGVKWVLGAIVLAIVAMSLRGAMEYGDMRAIDPTWRIFAGYQNPNAAAVITHAIGRSTDRIANKMIIRFHRSMYRYYQKHHLASMNLLLRPFAAGFALVALGTRASLFLLKNYKDALVRAVRK